MLAEISSICNDAKVIYDEDKKIYSNVGEPTEAALKIGCADDDFMRALAVLSVKDQTSAVNGYYENAISRLLTFKFSRDRKLMSGLIHRQTGGGALFVKGAPESVLERSTSIQLHGRTIPMSSSIHQRLMDQTGAPGIDHEFIYSCHC